MNAQLVNGTGQLACGVATGQPYADLTAPGTALAPGAKVLGVLDFSNPSNQAIHYSSRRLGGAGVR